jgi:hypothetical protein
MEGKGTTYFSLLQPTWQSPPSPFYFILTEATKRGKNFTLSIPSICPVSKSEILIRLYMTLLEVVESCHYSLLGADRASMPEAPQQAIAEAQPGAMIN